MVSVPLNRVTTTLGGAKGFDTKVDEYAESNQDETVEVFGAAWMAMVFTASETYTLSGLKLPLKRTGTIGEVSVSIQAISGGDPDGTDLSLNKFPGSQLPTTAVQKFISMPAVALTNTVQYAIVLRVADGDGSNHLDWDSDGSSPTYAGGQREISANSGNTWTTNPDDFIFETWK